ncbi:hypothetical protein [Tahibacter aquaticus]|nr:hypothetical protein [Tahibacter aquaticus]
MSITLRFVLSLLAAGLLAACASVPPRETAAAAKAPPGGLSGTAGEAGPGLSASRASRDIQLPAIVAIRRYDDVFRENGADVPVTVEYAWDYSRGVGIERVYARGGALRSQRDLPNQTMNFTDTEMELAFALAREDQRLSRVLAEPGLNFYAGFAYLDARDADCSRGSRCVHVIVSGGADGERAVAHAIVDLMQRKVVHPFYGTDNPAPVSQIHP